MPQIVTVRQTAYTYQSVRLTLPAYPVVAPDADGLIVAVVATWDTLLTHQAVRGWDLVAYAPLPDGSILATFRQLQEDQPNG